MKSCTDLWILAACLWIFLMGMVGFMFFTSRLYREWKRMNNIRRGR